MTIPDLNDIEPEALREAELSTVQTVLDAMVGKRVKSATIDDAHIAVTTEDGAIYAFYGFLGSGAPPEG
jgi:hypothetical protein